MSRKSKQIKTELLNLLQTPNVIVSCMRPVVYNKNANTLYVVSVAHEKDSFKFDMNIKTKNFGMARYTVTKSNGDKLSCCARTNAVFFQRPVARDMLEIYRALRLRHLIQKSRSK